MLFSRYIPQLWAGLALASAAYAPLGHADAAVLYGGQDNGAGAPVVSTQGSDPGRNPGSAALAAEASRLDGVRTYGGLRLGDGVSVEAAQIHPQGDASNSAGDALSLVGKAKVPLTDALSVTGKMGLQHQETSVLPGGSTDSNNLSPVYGVGLAYQTGSGVELRAESQRVAGRPGDLKALTGDSFLLGARVRF